MEKKLTKDQIAERNALAIATRVIMDAINKSPNVNAYKDMGAAINSLAYDLSSHLMLRNLSDEIVLKLIEPHARHITKGH